jgi:TfoX/Sxy family transcriptional regulator of competence genes
MEDSTYSRFPTIIPIGIKMSSDKSYVDFVIDQIDNAGEITFIHMFGEYGIYSNGKIFALVCDNKLFIKPTNAGRDFIQDVVEAPPYPGAKLYFLIEEKLEDREWITELVRITVNELPEPKPKKKKSKK